MIQINRSLSIPEDELAFSASRSSKPGGQNVNKVSTRVTVRFDVVGSPSLSADQKRRVLDRLATRVSKGGVLRVVSQRHRSQSANRRAAVERFAELLRGALQRPRPRRKTTTPLAAKRRRLEAKRRRSVRKQQRSQPISWDD